MTSTLLTRGSLIVDEELRDEASQAVRAAGDEKLVGLTLTTSTGRQVVLESATVELVSSVLRRVALGGQLTIQTVPELLTTSAAADLLGVSRPTVMKLIRRGELSSVMAGTHHRLRFQDVAAVRKLRESDRSEAIEELLTLGEDEE